MARHVRKGDQVMVIAGDDKGKTGEVLRVHPKRRKVLVQGVNRVFRHLRPSRQHPQGGRIQKELPIDISNVLPIDPKTGQPTHSRLSSPGRRHQTKNRRQVRPGPRRRYSKGKVSR